MYFFMELIFVNLVSSTSIFINRVLKKKNLKATFTNFTSQI